MDGKIKTVQPKLCSPISPDVISSPNTEEFVHYSKKMRSHAKYLNFCELNMKTRSEIFAYCFPLSSLVVYCLYCSLNVLFLQDTTQCYKQRTTLFQPYFVVRSLRILKSPLHVR